MLFGMLVVLEEMFLFFREMVKHLASGLSIFVDELKYFICVWGNYLSFRYCHKHTEPKQYWYQKFKGNEEYTQICKNVEYQIDMPHYMYLRSKFGNLAKIPYRYFQQFPDKKKNYVFGENTKFFPKTTPRRVCKIKTDTYYEGINFSNIIFSDFELQKVCFHNCSFWNCWFINLRTKREWSELEMAQGFSACDFYKCSFVGCQFNNMFFSMGEFCCVRFIDTEFNNSLLQRMSFAHVSFEKVVKLKHTNILSPSRQFDLSIEGELHVDSTSRVTAFDYYDRINFSLEDWIKNKKLRSYDKIADSFHLLDQVWKNNNIRENDESYANFYFQRRKAETRNKKGIKKLIGYLTEWSIGYGEKPFNALISVLVIAFAFSFLYMITGFKPVIEYHGLLEKWVQSILFSIFTLVTVGQGTAAPCTIWGQIVMSLELFFGAIIMTLFTSTLFRKYTK